MKKWLIIILISSVYVYYLISQHISQYPAHYEINHFPLITQPDNITCGPTSTTMLLQFYGKKIDVEEMRKRAKTTWFTYKGKPIGATFPKQLKKAFDSLEFKVEMSNGNLDRLKHYVSQNKPTIVLLRSGQKLMHWVVVVGYDENNVIIADPGWGEKRTMPTKVFLGAWNFTTDMEGCYYGNDFYHFLIVVAEECSNTYIVPNSPGPVDVVPTPQ